MELEFDGGSFRDPDGRVGYAQGRVFRVMSEAYGGFIRKLVVDGRWEKLLATGLFLPSRLIPSRDLGLDPGRYGPDVLEHEPLSLVSYPYEWPFDMLKDAALLTLEVLETCLRENLGLKDATPFNTALHGGRMTFVDWSSLEELQAGEPWAGYLQFCREFLHPLMLTAYRGVEFQSWFRGTLRGIEVPDMARLLTPRDWVRKGVLSHVVLHALLDRSFRSSSTSLRQSFREADFSKNLVARNAARLKKVVSSLRYPGKRSSEWLGYTQMGHYTAEERRAKEEFIRSALGGRKQGRVVDVGCNTGTYSLPLASEADLVIGLDADAACVNELYRNVRARNLRNYVPLVSDLLNPSPDQGWGLQERKSLFRRLRGDAFLALALVHHVCISGNVPLERFVDQLEVFGREGVVEWVDKKDPMVERLLLNRKDIFEEYRWDVFERLLRGKFEIVRVLDLAGGTRKLCHVLRRDQGSGT